MLSSSLASGEDMKGYEKCDFRWFVLFKILLDLSEPLARGCKT
jgi:hypothetical protein